MSMQIILSNIDELLKELKSNSDRSSVIIQRTIKDLGGLKDVVVYSQNKGISNINLITWLDVCYWMNHLSAFCEVVRLEGNSTNSISLFRDAANLSMVNAHVWSIYLCYAIGFYDFDDERFRENLMTLTKLHFKQIFSLIESVVKEQYKGMIERSDIKSCDNQIQELYRLWGRLKDLRKLEIDENSTLVEKIDNKIEKLYKDNNANPSFLDAIRGVTKEKLNDDVRSSQLEKWKFLMHMRNALAHNMTPVVSCEIIYEERTFTLVKSKRIDYYSDQFITLARCILDLYLELTDFKSNKNFKTIKDFFSNNKPAIEDN